MKHRQDPSPAGPEVRVSGTAAVNADRPPSSLPYFDWIDQLKFFGIIFIVLGHIHGIDPLVSVYLYSFHVPLFFFISGFLLNRRAVGLPHSQFFRKSLGTLMVPYLVFSAASYIVWYFVFRHFGEDATLAVDPLLPLAGMLYGVAGNDDHFWFHHNAALWFFPCLLVVQIYVRAVIRRFTLAAAAAIIAAGAAAAHVFLALSPVRLPWSMDVAMVASVFYLAGHALRAGGWSIDRLPPAALRASVVLALAVQTAAILVNGRVDLATGQFKDIPLYYLGAFAGIWIWSVVAIRLPPGRISRYFGRNTLIIFPIHLPVCTVITGIFVFVLGYPVGFEKKIGTVLIYTVACFLLTVPVIEIVNRFLPWMTGAGAPRPAG